MKLSVKFASVIVVVLISVMGYVGATERPNIVFILSDDQAWTDYGFMGNTDIQTPHLDELAEQSLLFKRGYLDGRWLYSWNEG